MRRRNQHGKFEVRVMKTPHQLPSPSIMQAAKPAAQTLPRIALMRNTAPGDATPALKRFNP
jgi:hypothetical protein